MYEKDPRPPNKYHMLCDIKFMRISLVPDRRSRIIPEVFLVRRGAVGGLVIWCGVVLGVGWGKGG